MPAPLLRPQLPRAVFGAGLVIGHLVLVAPAFFLLIWSFAPLLVGLGALVAATLVAWVVGVGHWSQGWPRVVQCVAAAALFTFYAAVAVTAISSGLDDVSTRSTFATPAGDAVVGFGIAAFAIVLIAVLIVVLPLPLRPRVVAIAAVMAALVGVGGLGASVAVSAGVDSCDEFRFDRARWKNALAEPDPLGHAATAERIASAVDRCGTVDGATRTKVRRLLGAPPGKKRTWEWSIGWTNDGIGPGDGQSLIVEFGVDDRARNVYLSPR